jgi:hypothetical protein
MSLTCGLELGGGKTELEAKVFVYNWENRMHFTRSDFVNFFTAMCNLEFKDRLNFMTIEMDLASDMLQRGGKISFNLHKQRVVCQGLTYRPQEIAAQRASCIKNTFYYSN